MYELSGEYPLRAFYQVCDDWAEVAQALTDFFEHPKESGHQFNYDVVFSQYWNDDEDVPVVAVTVYEKTAI